MTDTKAHPNHCCGEDGYVCEYGYAHIPNQTTIDAINAPDDETQTYASFDDLLKELEAEDDWDKQPQKQ